MSTPGLPSNLRLLLVHKQRTSARVRFLRLPHGMCAFAPLPETVELFEPTSDSIVLHPQLGLQTAEEMLQLKPGSLKSEPEFDARLRTPTGTISVHLASFTSIDPPMAAAAAIGGRFVALTEARDVPALELELLRRAYTVLMG